MSEDKQHHVQLLLLGSGWTGNFLLPLLDKQNISYAYTSQSGARHKHASQDSITFAFPNEADTASEGIDFTALPSTDNILVVFPLKSVQATQRLVEAYESAHPTAKPPRWIALGSTGAWGKGIHTSASPPSTPLSARAESEAALLSLDEPSRTGRRTAVLNLSGLYDDEIRRPANFAKRVGDTKEKLASKSSLHLVHGTDVARAILAVAQSDSNADVWGKRWIVSDTHVYDWWQLVTTLAVPPQRAVIDHADVWVKELMAEHDIASLPRPVAGQTEAVDSRFLDRALNGDDFWKSIGLRPSVGRCDEEKMRTAIPSSNKRESHLI